MDVFSQWGFRSAPFETTALPASELGETLLVGRSRELAKLQKRLLAPPAAATVEGANGVGKTSLINVATYKTYKEYFEKGKGPLLIPCQKIFQLSATVTANEFQLDVLLAVAQTLIQQGKELETNGRFPNTDHLDKWLNNPQYNSYQGGFQLPAFGVTGGRSGELNTTEGFLKSGIRQEVIQWLETVFPTRNDGGIVCIIDNLELLQTSQNARRVLEEIRDPLLAAPGLRWVLCGASGIVRSVAATPRLKGYLHNPIEVSGVAESQAPEILRSRILAFAEDPETVYVPITAKDFEHLYTLFNENIRHSLSYLNDYCLWVSDQDHLPKSDLEKHATYMEWLTYESDQLYLAVREQLRPRAWQTFMKALEMRGEFSPSDFSEFGFNSIEAMRPHVKELEEAALLQSTQDDADKRRKIVSVTANGWLVGFARLRSGQKF